MDVIESIILGIVQGLTEFLPVSSSGHIEIAKYLLGDDFNGEQGLFFTVLLHFATALSTVVFFKKTILDLILHIGHAENRTYIGWIILSMIPAVLIGLAFDDILTTLFDGSILLVAVMLIVTGGLLLFADYYKQTDGELSWGKALVIGIAQAIAILPGISRSGATISTALLLNVKREDAARFSFLMVIPVIFGKMAKDVLSGDVAVVHTPMYYIAGFIAAFVVGLIACKWMVELVKRAKLRYFAYYCFMVVFVIFVAYFAF